MQAPPHEADHYWYGDDRDVVEMLDATRRFRRADQEMRRRMARGMGMNVTDLQALQFVIAAERRGHDVTARQLSRDLGISTASTTKLLDRLTASGHLERRPHPSDRRALVIGATEHAHTEVRERLVEMHDRMAQIARDVPSVSRGAVVGFLEAMAAYLDEVGEPAALTPDV